MQRKNKTKILTILEEMIGGFLLKPRVTNSTFHNSNSVRWALLSNTVCGCLYCFDFKAAMIFLMKICVVLPKLLRLCVKATLQPQISNIKEGGFFNASCWSVFGCKGMSLLCRSAAAAWGFCRCFRPRTCRSGRSQFTASSLFHHT